MLWDIGGHSRFLPCMAQLLHSLYATPVSKKSLVQNIQKKCLMGHLCFICFLMMGVHALFSTLETNEQLIKQRS